MLTMAHGIQGDFDKVASEFPTGADGKEVDLAPFARRARDLAKKLATLLEQRAAKKALPFRLGVHLLLVELCNEHASVCLLL